MTKVVGPRFERLNRSWVSGLYMNVLMKYPSFLMVIQVKFLHNQVLFSKKPLSSKCKWGQFEQM